MMTTSSAFGIEKRITDPLMGSQVETPQNAPTPVAEIKKEEKPSFTEDQKRDFLRKAVNKFLLKQITEAELSTIFKVTE